MIPALAAVLEVLFVAIAHRVRVPELTLSVEHPLYLTASLLPLVPQSVPKLDGVNNAMLHPPETVAGLAFPMKSLAVTRPSGAPGLGPTTGLAHPLTEIRSIDAGSA